MFIEVFGKIIINMEKDNISLQMVIFIKGIFIKDQDMEKEDMFGMTIVVMKETGKLIKCMAMENIQRVKEQQLKDGSKTMNLQVDKN